MTTKEKEVLERNELFTIISKILREELIATYTQEDENVLKIRMVGGKEYLLTIQLSP